MILLSILTAQHSVLAYLIEKPSAIIYVYVYLNDLKKHSHHVDIRNMNNNNNNNNSNNNNTNNNNNNNNNNDDDDRTFFIDNNANY